MQLVGALGSVFVCGVQMCVNECAEHLSIKITHTRGRIHNPFTPLPNLSIHTESDAFLMSLAKMEGKSTYKMALVIALHHALSSMGRRNTGSSKTARASKQKAIKHFYFCVSQVITILFLLFLYSLSPLSSSSPPTLPSFDTHTLPHHLAIPAETLVLCTVFLNE